ncbi:MAG: damage-inducible protein DinB [Gemmatimonadetes bacterium]|nr:MAG: damage-inducible protein DinB [Gemmatimonadota bacterium]
MNEKAVLVDQAARQASPRHYYPNNLLIRIPTMPRASARSKSSRKSSKSRKPTRKPARKSTARSIKQESPHALLFPDLESELATTRRMLERVPNGNNDWRPHTKSRTLGELATHVAQLPGFGILMLTRNEFDGLGPRQPEPRFSTSAERVKMFDELSAQLRSIFQQMTWDQAQSPWTLRLGDKVVLKAPRTTILRTAFVTHAAHHRAQLGVYLRMLETPVPWSYGRSADEEPPAI